MNRLLLRPLCRLMFARQALAAVLGTNGFIHSGLARRGKALVVVRRARVVARGMRRNSPLYVGVALDVGGGDEV